MLKVTGFNIKEQMRIIENKTQTVDLQVEEQVLTIREGYCKGRTHSAFKVIP